MTLYNSFTQVKSTIAKLNSLTAAKRRLSIFTIQKWVQMLNKVKIQTLYTNEEAFNL